MGCGFNRSVQHLISNDREEDVENEAATFGQYRSPKITLQMSTYDQLKIL